MNTYVAFCVTATGTPARTYTGQNGRVLPIPDEVNRSNHLESAYREPMG